MHVSFGVVKYVRHCRTSGFGGKSKVKLNIRVKQLKENRLTLEDHKRPTFFFWGGGLKQLDPLRSATWIFSNTVVVT